MPTSNHETVEELFKLAIELEKYAEKFYLGLETKFADYPVLAVFWRLYAQEEARHARMLEDLASELFPLELAAPAPKEGLDNARQLLQTPVDTLLAQVTDLDQAYEIAFNLENSETNSLFHLLFQRYSVVKESEYAVTDLLREHIAKLVCDFPAPYNKKAERLSVLAQ